MQLLQGFDATTVDPTQGAGQMPIGKHPVIIAGSEIKATSSGNGGMLVLDLAITDGPNKGQTGAYRLNLYNPNQQAAQIAQRQLSAICHVTGVFKVSDSSQLHNIPFVVEVGYQKGEEPGPNNPDAKGYTEVKKVFDMHGNEPGKKPANATPQPAAQSFAPPSAPPAQQAPAGPGWSAPAAQTPPPAAPAAPAWSAPAQPAAGFPAQSAPPAAAPWQQAPTAQGGSKPPWAS